MRAVIRDIAPTAGRAFRSFLRHQGPNHAAAGAFHALLSAVPLFFLAVLLLGEALGDRGQALSIAARQLSGVVPWFDDELMGRVRRLTWAAPRMAPLGMAAICWTAGLFFAMLRRNLLLPWREPRADSPPDWRGIARFWLVTPLASLCLLAVLAGALYASALPGLALSRAEARQWAWLVACWNLLWPWAFVCAVYVVLLPGVRPLRLTLGVSGALSLAGWGLTALFGAVLSRLPRAGLVYGPLADAVLFLLWLNYNTALVVYGGHFIRLWRREHPGPSRIWRVRPRRGAQLPPEA